MRARPLNSAGKSQRIYNSMSPAAKMVKENAPQADHHTCHWPGCIKGVAPRLWGCYPHWMRLPKRLRDEIWRTYRPGQEITKTPSAEYLSAARAVQDWITSQGARP